MKVQLPEGVSSVKPQTQAFKKPTSRVAGVPMHPLALKQDVVRFSGKTQEDKIKEEAREMARSITQEELIGPHLFRGSMPLDYLSKVDTKLSPEKHAELEAYTTLIKVGLRPKNLSAADEKAALAKIENPSPQVASWMKRLNITAETLRTSVVDAHEIDQNNDVPPEVHQRASDLGLYRLKVPAEYGGLGFHQKEYSKVLEAFTEVPSTVGSVISAHSTIGSAPLIMFGTPEQKKKYLAEVATGQSLAAFGLTEPLAGTDLGKMTTTATLSEDGKHWVLNGEKLFITNSIDSGLMYVITGKTIVGKEEMGPTVLIVELPFKVNEPWEEKKRKLKDLADQGMRLTPFTRDAIEMMMIRGSDQSYIQFKDFKVPVDNVLGKQGKGKIVPLLGLNKGRAGFGPLVTAAATWFAAETVKQSVDREMFDMYSPNPNEPGRQSNMEYVRGRLGRMHIKAAQLKAVSDLITALIDDNPDKSVAALSAAIKVRATQYGWENAQDAAELYGGHGLIKGAPNSIERNFRDAWIPLIVEGVNPAMAQLALLVSGKPVQKEMTKPAGMWNMLKSQLNYFEKGAMPLSEAFWIQRQTKAFSRKFGLLGVMHGDNLAKEQNLLIRCFNIYMDLLTLAAVQIKLNKEKGSLGAEETAALRASVKELKARIPQELKYVRTSGNPIEKSQVAVGDAYIQADMKTRQNRKNTQDLSLAYLRQRADRFFNNI